MAECGCKVDHRRGAAQAGRFIAYCPMHAAARDMLEALEAVGRELGVPDDSYPANVANAYRIAAQAAARGGEA